MPFNTVIRTPVGADLSRPAPIYRPSLAFRSPDEHVKKHHRALVGNQYHTHHTKV